MNIDKNLKYHFLINGIKFKNFNIFESIFFSLNLINIIYIYGSSLFCLKNIFKTNDFILKLNLFFIFSDIYVVIMSNKIEFKKNISRNFSIIISNKYKNYSIYLLRANLFVSIIISITLLIFDLKINLLNNIKFNKHYTNFFLIFYTLNLKLNIITVFFILLKNLSILFSDYINKIKVVNININNLLIHYLEVRYIYNKTIKSFNTIISNILSLYYVPVIYLLIHYNLKNFDIFYHLNSAIYILFLIIFQYLFESLQDSITYIKSNIDKSSYLKSYITRKEYLYHVETNNLNDISTNELLLKTYLLDIENSNLSDWNLLSFVINQKLRCFDIFGIEFDNSTLIYKIFSLSIILIIGKKVII